ncbi:MAG: hypothetical protein AAFO99_09585 [Bacteroidota bacterium]
MWHRWLTYLKEGPSYAGLEICEHQGELRSYLLELRRKNDTLHIVKETILDGLEDIPGHIGKKVPLFLSVNTSKVLVKQTTGEGSDNPEPIVDRAFPNLDLRNFYYEVARTPGGPIVAISKRDHVDELVAKLNNIDVFPTHTALGITGIQSIAGYLDNGTVGLSNLELSLTDGRIEGIRPLSQTVPKTYRVNGLLVPGHMLTAFSCVTAQLGKRDIASNLDDANRIARKGLADRRIFNFTLRAALFFFLGLLLLNFAVFEHYFSGVASLRTALERNDSQIRELEQLLLSVDQKQQRVERYSSSSSSRASYYMDQLAMDMPLSLLMGSMDYRPLERPVSDAKHILLKKDLILVTGSSNDPEAFSQWVIALEKLPWTLSVETTDYDYVSKTTSDFSLKIMIDEQWTEK